MAIQACTRWQRPPGVGGPARTVVPAYPPPPVCPVAALDGFEVLPGDQCQQAQRAGPALIQVRAVQGGEQRDRDIDQRRD
jgi:hypothetical protein